MNRPAAEVESEYRLFKAHIGLRVTLEGEELRRSYLSVRGRRRRIGSRLRGRWREIFALAQRGAQGWRSDRCDDARRPFFTALDSARGKHYAAFAPVAESRRCAADSHDARARAEVAFHAERRNRRQTIGYASRSTGRNAAAVPLKSLTWFRL